MGTLRYSVRMAGELYELLLLSEEMGSEKVVKKAIESLLKEADIRALSLCLDFLRKAVG